MSSRHVGITYFLDLSNNLNVSLYGSASVLYIGREVFRNVFPKNFSSPTDEPDDANL